MYIKKNLKRTRLLYKPQAHSFDHARKCEVIKIYSGLSVLLVITVILGVRERMHSQPHLVASSGGREKIRHLGVKQTKQSFTIKKCARKYLFLESTCLSIESTYFLFVVMYILQYVCKKEVIGTIGRKINWL